MAATDSAGIEKSVAAELWTKGKWSMDVIGTDSVGGLGVSRDIGPVDVGVYGVSSWTRWEPEIGLGLSVGF